MKVGDTVLARVTVTAVDVKNKRIKLDTVCSVGERVVLDGEAMLMVSSRAQAERQRRRVESAAGLGEGGVVPPGGVATQAAE